MLSMLVDDNTRNDVGLVVKLAFALRILGRVDDVRLLADRDEFFYRVSDSEDLEWRISLQLKHSCQFSMHWLGVLEPSLTGKDPLSVLPYVLKSESRDILVYFINQVMLCINSQAAATQDSRLLSQILCENLLSRSLLLVAGVLLRFEIAQGIDLPWTFLSKLPVETAVRVCNAFSFLPSLQSVMDPNYSKHPHLLHALRICDVLGVTVTEEQRRTIVAASFRNGGDALEYALNSGYMSDAIGDPTQWVQLFMSMSCADVPSGQQAWRKKMGGRPLEMVGFREISIPSPKNFQ